jgi:MT0933-like antitoxin protein
MSMFDELKNKAADFVKDNPDKVEGVSDSLLDKAADLADSATGGKFTEHIETAQEKADDAIGT